MVSEYVPKARNCELYRLVDVEPEGPEAPSLFDAGVDRAYILTLEPEDREDRQQRIEIFKEQLRLYRPHTRVTVQYGGGYRDVSKRGKWLPTTTAACDLADAYANVFAHACRQGYHNVLVFEDDFLFEGAGDEKKLEDLRQDCAKISKFVSRDDWGEVYHLGTFNDVSVPLAGAASDLGCHRVARAYGYTHGAIYSRSYWLMYLENYEDEEKSFAGRSFEVSPNSVHVDRFWNESRFRKFVYHKPLCFQYFPLTENAQQSWAKECCGLGRLAVVALQMEHSTGGFKLLHALQRGFVSSCVWSPWWTQKLLCSCKPQGWRCDVEYWEAQKHSFAAGQSAGCCACNSPDGREIEFISDSESGSESED